MPIGQRAEQVSQRGAHPDEIAFQQFIAGAEVQRAHDFRRAGSWPACPPDNRWSAFLVYWKSDADIHAGNIFDDLFFRPVRSFYF